LICVYLRLKSSYVVFDATIFSWRGCIGGTDTLAAEHPTACASHSIPCSRLCPPGSSTNHSPSNTPQSTSPAHSLSRNPTDRHCVHTSILQPQAFCQNNSRSRPGRDPYRRLPEHASGSAFRRRAKQS